MKNLRLLVCTVMSFMAAQVFSQDIHVSLGNVTYIHSAEEVGDMTFDNSGTTLTIQGKTYTLSEVSSMEVKEVEGIQEEYTVKVNFNGTTATVNVTGDLASEVDVEVQNADVTITVDPDFEEEITYVLSGCSANGSFTMNGDYKSTLFLENLTLTSTTGAPITVNNGKRIELRIEGVNTLTDAPGGTQEACLYIDGHPQIGGDGSLNITANAGHGISSDDYILVQSGEINILSAADGLHMNQFFMMNGGTVNITSNEGDGIDVGFKGVNKGTKDQYESNGFTIIYGGSLSVITKGSGAKGIKCDSTIYINDGTINIRTYGDAYYDSEEDDINGGAAIKPGGEFLMDGGTVYMLSSGLGCKGINADGNIKVTGGELTAITTGNRFEYADDDSKPQAIRTKKDMYMTGGLIKAAVMAEKEKAHTFKCDYDMVFQGATIIGIGGKAFAPAYGKTQNYMVYTNQNIVGGQSYTYDGIEFFLPTEYNKSNAFVLTSTPDM